MKQNVGDTDVLLRIVAGILILLLFFLVEGNARWWALVGLVPLATGAFRFCPLYSMLGVSTCALKKAQ